MELLRSIRFETDYAIITYRGSAAASYPLDFERDFFTSLPPSTEEKPKKEKKNNRHKGELSLIAYQRLKRAVSWLELISEEKKGNVPWKCSFLTLTVPDFSKELHEKLLKKLLNNFLTWMRKRKLLKSYVWKAELTKRGNLHYHLLTDSVLNEFVCRKKWNEMLLELGLLSQYKDKFSKMSMQDYLDHREKFEGKAENEYKEMKRQQAYNYGCMTEWSDPRSVQLDEIPSTDSVVNYLGKYLGKKSSGSVDEKLTGRIWGCSQNLSHKNTLRLEIDPMSKEVEVLHELLNHATACEDIEVEINGTKKTIGYKVRYSSSIWSVEKNHNRLCTILRSYFMRMKAGELRHDHLAAVKRKNIAHIEEKFRECNERAVLGKVANKTGQFDLFI